MDFRDIFDRNTNTQFSILLYLTNFDTPVDKSKIIKDLNISTFILDKSLEELAITMDSLDVGMKIVENKSQETFMVRDYLWNDLEKIYRYFLNNAMSYKLIVYLYKNRTYVIQNLAEEFSISEATVYRLIAKINESIAEFDVKIKNGRMLGDNLQLSHFFFQFFWNSLSIQEIEEHVTDPEILRFVSLLESKLGRKFNHSARMRIALWCRILKYSSTKNVAVSKTALELVDEFQADPLYQVVKESYFLSLSYSAIFGSDYKAASIYIFLSTGFYIGNNEELRDGRDGWPTYSTRVVELNNLIFEQIKAYLHIENKRVTDITDYYWKYLLTQVHSAIVYLRGIIVEYDSKLFFSNLFPDLIQLVNEPILEKLIVSTEDYIGEKLIGVNRRYVTWIYSYAIDQIRQMTSKPVSIGVHLLKSPLLTVVYVENLKNAYGKREFLEVEAAKVDRKYDILISDSITSKKDFTFKKFFATQDVGVDYTMPLRENNQQE